MRRPFGGNGGMGGGLGGGGMLKTVQRSLRTGVGGASQESFSHSTATATAAANSTTRQTYKPTTANLLSLSSSTGSSPFSSFNQPVSAAPTLPSWDSCSSLDGSEEFEWECVDGGEYEGGIGFCDDYIFGSVPSKDEVHHAVCALQQVVDSASFSQSIMGRFAYNSDKGYMDELTSSTHTLNIAGTELDWIEPPLQQCNSRMLHPCGSERVYDAFHMLQTEPCIQRMVISLSTDKAVWDAVLNNDVVRELRETMSEADNSVPENMSEGSGSNDAATSILSWIFNNTKAKVMEMFEKVTKLVNELFPPAENEKATTRGGEGDADSFEERLRTSFMLSVIILLIVVVSRARGA